MGYYFECDSCINVVPISGARDFNLSRECEDCGVEGCDKCIGIDGLCWDCSAREDDDQRLDNDDDE